VPCGHWRATVPPLASWTFMGKSSSPLLGCLEERGPASAVAGGLQPPSAPAGTRGSTHPCAWSSWLGWLCPTAASGRSLLPTGLRCLSSTALSSSVSTMPMRSCSSSSTWWVSHRCVSLLGASEGGPRTSPLRGCFWCSPL